MRGITIITIAPKPLLSLSSLYLDHNLNQRILTSICMSHLHIYTTWHITYANIYPDICAPALQHLHPSLPIYILNCEQLCSFWATQGPRSSLRCWKWPSVGTPIASYPTVAPASSLPTAPQFCAGSGGQAVREGAPSSGDTSKLRGGNLSDPVAPFL